MELHGFMNKGIRHQCERCFIKYKIFQEKEKKILEVMLLLFVLLTVNKILVGNRID